jgi:hypothetical protein
MEACKAQGGESPLLNDDSYRVQARKEGQTKLWNKEIILSLKDFT